MRQPGHREGVRRNQRWGQTALDVGPTLDKMYSLPVDDPTDGSYLGTCQSCGSYLDVRFHQRCPHIIRGRRCDGYIG